MVNAALSVQVSELKYLDSTAPFGVMLYVKNQYCLSGRYFNSYPMMYKVTT